MKLVIDSLYAAPIVVWAKIVQATEVSVEVCSYYEKGSYRNRCHIYGANGLLRLSIPIKHGKEQKTTMKGVAISYDHSWQDLHWQSLCSAYRRSPFFEYYEDDLVDLYQHKVELLMDFNSLMMQRIASLLNLKLELSETASYRPEYDGSVEDGRNASSPKQGSGIWDRSLKLSPYEQLFQPKHGFLKNLSILDLLFHKGPEAVTYLHSIKQI